MAGVGQSSALQEKQVNPARVKSERENCQRGFLIRAETNGKCVVVIVDDLYCAGQALSHLDQCTPGGRGNLRVVFFEECIELMLGSHRLCAPFHSTQRRRPRQSTVTGAPSTYLIPTCTSICVFCGSIARSS